MAAATCQHCVREEEEEEEEGGGGEDGKYGSGRPAECMG